ncbi:dynein axonemal heavy chain 2-like [Panulirus ornatus]|uniref:dynein axonemal heavy chain 2-like n=1 Tax=Panulirus ornatus TaxID=150431 RepID=UPI003A8C702D
MMSVKASGAGDGGAEGELLEEELAQVDRVLEAALKAVARKSHLVFNLTSKEWLKHFDRFRESMEEVERRYQCVMVAAVQTVESVAQGLRVLNVFKPLAARKSLFSVFYVMIDHILNLFDRDFEEVEKEYVFKSMKVGGEGFYYSKMAKWAADTRKKLEHEVNLLKHQSWLPYYPRLDSIYERWGRTAALLRGVVSNMYAAWNASLEPNPSKRLMEPIFRWRPGPVQTLQDNFDMQLYKNLEEAAAWKAMGFDIPESISPIFTENEAYMQLKKQVTKCADGFNSFMTRMSRDEAQLFEAQIQVTVMAFFPGLSSVSWVQKQQATALLVKCNTIVRAVQDQVTQYLTVNQSLSNILMKTKKMVLYAKDDGKVYEDDAFQEDLMHQLDTTIEGVKTGLLQMEEILDALYKKLINKSIVKSHAAWLSYVLRIDNLFLECQNEIQRKSLLSFEGMLMGSRSCPTEQLAPVFKLSASLTNERIVCRPSVNRVLKVVTTLKTKFSGSLGKIPCLLRRFALDKAKAHDHLPVLEDELCDKLQKKLTSEFQTQVDNLKDKLEYWQVYRDLWEVNRAEFFEHYLKNAISVYVFETDIMTFEKKLREIEGVDDHWKVGTFYINCDHLKQQLISLCRSWIAEFESNLFKIASSKLDSLYNYSKDTRALLKSSPRDIPSFLSATEECHSARHQLSLYREEFQPVREQFEVLKKYRYAIPTEAEERLARLEDEWNAVETSLTDKILELNMALEDFRKAYNDRSDIVMEEVLRLKVDFQQMLPTRSDKTVVEAKENIEKLKTMMTDIIKKLDINAILKLLSLPEIEFSELPAFQHDLVSVEKMWVLLEEWQKAWESWAGVVVWEVSVVALQETLSVYGHKIRAVQPSGVAASSDIGDRFAVRESEWELKEEILTQIELCKLLVPLTLNLQSANLRSHHWRQIQSLVSTEFDKDSETFTLGYLQKLNLTSYKKEMATIILDSTEETKIVNETEDIKSLASQITLNLKPIASMGISVVESTTDANSTIAELNMRLQVLSASHHAKPYIEDITDIRSMLSSMMRFLENVEELQKKWGTWEPFFHVPDVRLHLVQATAVFDSLNERWRKISVHMTTERFLRPVALQEHLQEEVRSVSEEFNGIARHIKPYLQDRKEQYSRFWLLSDAELVAAISTVFDGEYAKPFLPKLFTNVAKIKQEKNSQKAAMEIIGVYSKEGEFLELNSYVPILGSFDSWLKNLTTGVEATLKENVKQCRNNLKSAAMKIDDVVKLWPLQVSVLSFLLHWTVEVSRALAKLKGHINSDQLQVFKKRTRDSQMRLDGCLQGNLPKLMREKIRLFYLTVLQMRDFFASVSESRKGVTSESDMMQRYSWDKDSDNLLLQISAYDLPYSWEYQGLWSFAAVTPSTVRSMHNLARVLNQGLAAGLLGAHGTGKTETVKTMAHLLGRHLVTIACTAAVTSVQLAQALLGISQSHCWLLLEAVHHLELDVVPVLGEMLHVIQEAQRAAGAAGTKSGGGRGGRQQPPPIKLLEGMKVSVSPMAAVLLEMDPSYPASLKAMDILKQECRPVVMFSPELQVIAECLMLVEGFKEYKTLSQKLSQAMESLSTSLPRRYRCLLTTKSSSIVVASAKDIMKRQPEIDEIDTIPLALREYLTPQLRENDLPVFKEVTEMLFPDFEAAPLANESLRDAVVKDMKDKDLTVKDVYVDKILQLHEALLKNQITILFGSSGSGKSTSLKILENTYNKLHTEGNLNYRGTRMEFLSPLILEPESLYGPREEMVIKTSEGYLPHAIRRFHRSSPTAENWLVLEGQQGHDWLRQFFLHLHFTKNCFLYGHREMISLPSNLKIILEVGGDVSHLSPAELSSCCAVYFPAQPKLWEDIIHSWRGTISNNKISRALQTLIVRNLPNFINILDSETITKPHMVMKAKAFVAIMKSFMDTELVNTDPEDWVVRLTPAFIFSIIWSFGADISPSEAAAFQEVVTRMIEDVPEGGIYDYFVDVTTGHFAPWQKLAPSLEDLRFRVPVIDSDVITTDRIIKYPRMIQLLMAQGIPVLLKGAPGSAKTTIINVLKQTHDPKRQATVLSYTAGTRPRDIQNMIEGCLMKQGASVLACKRSKLHLLIDDLHCSEGETQLHEILATVKFTANHGRLYSHESKAFLQVPDICYMFTFQTKECRLGQERAQEISNHVDTYWSESFHTLRLPDFENNELEGIFKKLFDKTLGHLEQEVKCLKTVVAEAIVYLYRRMEEKSQVQCRDHVALVSHPRQVISMLRGLQLGDEETQDRDNFLKHLTHECYRVFQDSALIPQPDFDKLMKEFLTEYLCLSLDSVCTDSSLFLLTRLGNEENLYTDTDIENLCPLLKSVGQSLIGDSRTFAMYGGLVHHTVRLLRILGNPKAPPVRPSGEMGSPAALESIGGHIVSVGPEGCGKKTCARLASSVAGFKIYDIIGTAVEATEQREKIIRDMKTGIHILVVIDWNILENVRNLKFLNDLLVEQQYNEEANDFKTNIKILASVPSLREAHEILRYIPAVSSFYSVDTFQEWCVEDLQNIAKQILMEELGKSLSDMKAQTVAEIMVFIHCNTGSNSSARFLDFLALYLQLYTKLFTDISQEKERLNTSIAKFEETQKRVTELSNQLEEQRAQVTYIQQSCGSVVLKMRNIKSEQGRLEQDLAKNAALLKRQKDESARIGELISRDLSAPKLEMKTIHRKLDRITRAEFESLKSLGRPPRCVELVFDAVLSTLGFDPSWNEARKQMGNCLNFISSVRKIPVEDTNEKILARIQSYLKMEELNVDKVKEESPTAAVFLTWLHAFEKYVRVYKDYHPLKVQADIIDRDIEATEEAINQYERDLAGFGVEHQILMTQLKEKEHQLEAAEEEMKILEGRIQLAQKVMAQLGADKIHWEETLSQCSVKLRNIFGDAVLAAAYVTYTGSFTHSERQAVVKGWHKKMDELCIFHTKDRNILEDLALLESQVKWHEEGLPLDAFSLENASIICGSKLPQLILDPHSILERWIRNWKDTVVVDLKNSNYLQDLEQIMANGKTCLIVQEELSLPIHVLQILEMERIKSDEANKVLIKAGEKRLDIHENFKLLILIKSRKVHIGNNIMNMVNLVNIESQQDGLEILLTSRVASYCQPDLMEALKKSEWDLLDRQRQLAEQEETIRSLMSRFDDDVLEESTLMEMLQAACAKATEAKKKCNDLKRTLDTARESIDTYRKVAQLLTQLYLMVERFPRLQPSLTIGLDHFSDLVTSQVRPQSFTASWGRMLDQNFVIKMLQSLYRHFQEQVSRITLVTVGLLLAMWYECHIGIVTPGFCSLLYTPLVPQGGCTPLIPSNPRPQSSPETCSTTQPQPHQLEPPVALRPSWLTERQWLQVLALTTVEPFCELADHMVTHESLWRVWYITEQPETGTLPKKMERKIRGVAKLILINCLRPDRLDEAATLYVHRVLKQEASEATVKALLSVASKGRTTEPIIMYCSATLDVQYILQQIQPLCHPMLTGNAEALDMVALGQGREDSLSLRLRRCVQKGYWLLLKKSTDARSCINCLNTLLKDKIVKEAHRRFQVWMYFDSDDELPVSLMTSCHKVYLTLPSTVKESLRHLYELIGESRLAAYSSEWSKWCLLSLALFHIAFVTRQTLENNFTPLAQTLGDSQWEEAESILRSLVTGVPPADSTLVPSLTTQLSNIYISGALTEESHNILSRLLHVYISPEAIQNVPGRVSALTHYTVPRTTSMEDHFAQMDFIYLAQNVSLTGVAPMIILQNQRDEAKDVSIALRTVNRDRSSRQVLQDTGWLKRFDLIRSRKLPNVKLQGSLQSVLKQEFDDFQRTSQNITSKLTVSHDLSSLHEVLDDGVPDCQEEDEQQQMEAKLSRLLTKGDMLYHMIRRADPPRSIRLGLLREPAVAWAALTRSCWGELRAEGLEVVMVTKALSASLSTKGNEADGKVSEEDETPTVVMERLVLRGARWDAGDEVVMTEELGAGTPASPSLDLPVMQYTTRVKKTLRKSSRVHRTPVYVSDDDKAPPLFWIYMPLAATITGHTCLLSGVRLLTS